MINVDGVTFRYEGAKQNSLKNVDLHIKQGECVVLTGVSGCGKTTMTRIINGLIPHFYTGELRGRIIASGKNIIKSEPHELSETIGSVFQNPRTQFFNTDTTSEVVFGMENMGIPYEEMHRRFNSTILDLNLKNLKNRDIFALSGGEKQRIAFGGVYALSPEIYVLDEPTANLDMKSIQNLRDALLYVKKQGKTILIAEHRLYYLDGIADRIILMENGAISKEWTSKSFSELSNSELASYGLRAFQEIPLPETINTSHCPYPSIEIHDLEVRYGKHKVLSGYNFEAKQSEIIGITGANGNGKTTLARTICGLHQESKGQVLFNKKPIKPKRRNRYAYLVMQDPNYQLFSDSVEEELKLSAFKKQNSDDEINNILQKLNLIDVKTQHPLSLSGGQKQRLAIALAILSPADVLIFDEPTSGLDFRNMQQVSEILRMLADSGKTILIITHDNELLKMGCNRIVHLK